MSHIINDEITQMINNTVCREWGLQARPDLLDDSVNYVTDELMSVETNVSELMVIRAMISFYESKCFDAMSSQDLEHMAQSG